MASELPYLPTYKNVDKLFKKIESAKRPDAFTTRFLSETLGLKSTGDRALISLLKALGFLDQAGKPTPAYNALKNSEEAPKALAEAIQRAYEPLFSANENAHALSADALRGLVAQVAGTDKGMTSKIAGTFNSLVRLADFSAAAPAEEEEVPKREEEEVEEGGRQFAPGTLRHEFHYNIQIHLPANGSEETYLNIFNAVRKTFR